MQRTWDQRAEDSIAQGCLTYSKRSDQFVKGVYPTHWEEFHGIDFVCGFGSNIIGFENNHSLPTVLEVVLAERMKEMFPFTSKWKFLKTGSAACSAAVRVARAYTGRSWVYGCGYHGTDNTFISQEEPGAGCVDESYLKFNSKQDLIKALSTDLNPAPPAAVIVEPVQLDASKEEIDRLKTIRRICREQKIVLIFDEIVSGFRVPKYCFSSMLDIYPDLICLGKAMGNGHPIAALGGPVDMMDNPDYFISNTHNGEMLSITKALTVCSVLTESVLSKLWENGAWFQSVFNGLHDDIKLVGYPTRAELRGPEEEKALFMQEMMKRGIMFGKAWFINMEHLYSLSHVLEACKEVMNGIKAGAFSLEGSIPQQVFRRNP